MSSKEEFIIPEKNIRDQILETEKDTRESMYADLSKIYFLPKFTSNAITIKALLNLAEYSDNYYCPYKLTVERTEIHMESNYLLQDIHLITNTLCYQKFGCLLFFDQLADWDYYQTLIQLEFSAHMDRIYEYKYFKPHAPQVTQTFSGRIVRPKIRGSTIFYGKVVENKEQAWGQGFAKSKAAIENKYIGRELKVTLSNGNKTELERTYNVLFTQTDLALKTFRKLEDSLNILKNEYKEAERVYALNQQLLKLRVHPVAWDAVYREFEPLMQNNIANELTTADNLLLKSQRNPRNYLDHPVLKILGFPNSTMKEYWAKVNSEEGLKRFMNSRFEAYQRDLETKNEEIVYFSNIITQYKAVPLPTQYYYMAWLLSNSKQPRIVIENFTTQHATLEYYLTGKHALKALGQSQSVLKSWMEAADYYADAYKQKNKSIRVFDIILKELLTQNTIEIKEIVKRANSSAAALINLNDMWLIFSYRSNCCMNKYSSYQNTNVDVINEGLYLVLLKRLLDMCFAIGADSRMMYKIAEFMISNVNLILLSALKDYLLTVLPKEFEAPYQELTNKYNLTYTAQIYIIRIALEGMENIESTIVFIKDHISVINKWVQFLRKTYSDPLKVELYSIIVPTSSTISLLNKLSTKDRIVNAFAFITTLAECSHNTQIARIAHATCDVIRFAGEYRWTDRSLELLTSTIESINLTDMLQRVYFVLLNLLTDQCLNPRYQKNVIVNDDYTQGYLFSFCVQLYNNATPVDQSWQRAVTQFLNEFPTQFPNDIKNQILSNMVYDANLDQIIFLADDVFNNLLLYDLQ